MAEDRSDRVGLNLLRLVGLSRDWVRRRSEHLELLDRAVARRTVRLDIDLQTLAGSAKKGWLQRRRRSDEQTALDEAQWPSWRGGLLVPLNFVRKGKYADYEVRGAQGELLPRLTLRETRTLVRSGLRLAIEETVRAQRELLISILDRVVWSDGRQPLSELVPAGVDRNLLSLFDIAHRFDLIVVLLPRAQSRHVVTYARVEPVEEALPRSRGSRDWTGRTSGVRPMTFSASGIGKSDSFHITLAPPADIHICESRLVVATTSGRLVPAYDRERLPTRAHISVDGQPDVAGCVFSTVLFHAPTGLVAWAPASCLLTFLALAGGCLAAVFSDGNQVAKDNEEVAAALLLVVPAVVGSLLVVIPSHALTARLLARTRGFLTVATAMPLVAGTGLVFKWTGSLSIALWGGAATVALVCLALLANQFWSLRQRERQVAQPADSR